jgi:hypothetical protein
VGSGGDYVTVLKRVGSFLQPKMNSKDLDRI